MKNKMSLQRDIEKYLSGSIFLTLLLIIIISCKKEDLPVNDDEPLIRKEDSLKTYSPTVKFEVTGRLLKGNELIVLNLTTKEIPGLQVDRNFSILRTGFWKIRIRWTFQSVISQ